MNKHQAATHLDLAPKLRRPLCLWNPLDYLRLLYWVFLFPQALRWYEDTFGGGFVVYEQISWKKRWALLRQNTIQRQFFIQGLMLIVLTPLILARVLQKIGLVLDWSGVHIGVFGGVAIGVISCVGFGVAFGVGMGLAFSVSFGILSNVALTAAQNIILHVFMFTGSRVLAFFVFLLINGGIPGAGFGIAFGVALSLALSVGSNVVYDKEDAKADEILPDPANVRDMTKPMLIIIFVGMSVWLVTKLLVGDVVAVVERIAQIGLLVVGIAAALMGAFRIENWLFGIIVALRLQHNKLWLFAHATPLPIPSLSSKLTNWLRSDWETGLYNVNQLLAYSLQFIPVIQAVNRVLAETPPAQILFRVAQLAENPYKWKLVYSASASLADTIKLTDTKTRLDTPARAAAAGFWYLHQKKPEKALEAFERVNFLYYGQEMYFLAAIIAEIKKFKDIHLIDEIRFLEIPDEPLLRPFTWKAIASFKRVIENIKIVERSTSRSARSFALNRALGELKNIVNKRENLPQAERDLIIGIAENWQEILLRISGQVGEIAIPKPIRIPYVIGDPVYGNLFVGREDIMRQLEELWVFRYQLQSVLIFGHRRMGKTSILLNAAKCLESQVKVAYVNLLNVANIPQGVGEVMIAISDSISETVNLPHPSDADFLNLPYPTFKRYLKQVEANLDVGLIIALDEFEKIEELIENGKIHQDFIGVLRGLVQMSPKIAFAFAGAHTLEEMTADYFQPFFASFITIPVGFLERGATCQILANPDEDFPLDYKPEALNLIYDLTAGQPYLVQLMGFQLVRRYNDQVFEMGRSRDRVFTVEDVEEVVNDPEFFKRGRYYFDGVWSQAVQGISGQQTILRSIAPHPEGLTINAIAQSTAIDETTVKEALNTLKRHDVVGETNERWHIIVELFRRWVLDL